MPKPNRKACIPSRNNMRINKAHIPASNKIRINTGFRGNTHHTRTQYNPGSRRSIHHTTRPKPSSGVRSQRGNVHHNKRRTSNPGNLNHATRGRGNMHHKKTNPSPGNSNHPTRTHPTSGGRRNIHHKQKTNSNPGNAGKIRQTRSGRKRNPNTELKRHHTPRTQTNPGVKRNINPKKEANPNPANRQMAKKIKIMIQTGKTGKPRNRKPLSVAEKMKRKLKANRELLVRPKVQRSVLEMLKQKLKSKRVLTVRPKVRSVITPDVTVHPVCVSGTHVHTPAYARPNSYQPHYRIHHDHGNMEPHSSQDYSRISAVPAPSRRTDTNEVDHENVAEITDENLQFLKSQRAELIAKIKNVVGILDHLDLSSEKEAIVRAEATDQAKMRKLLEFTTSSQAAERLLNVLWEHAGDVMDDLEDCSEAEDEVENEAWNDAGDDDDAEDEVADEAWNDAKDDAEEVHEDKMGQ